MADIQLFQPDGDTFERCCRANGDTYWSARDFMDMLGYETFQPFELAINRAIATCTTLGIPVIENFKQIETASGESDFKLSRFACYLVAMNGDVRKPAVAVAQAYFATLANAAQEAIQNSVDVERVQIRDEITDRERSLSSTASQLGVDKYHFFQNEGYRGMYNMNLSALKAKKGLSDKSR
jgi:DNA-damage-inducible protein D